MRPIFALLVWLMLPILNAHAQPSAVVTGLVVQPDGTPTAAVVIGQQGSGRSTLSDADGRFTLHLTSAGTHTLVARHVGFATATRTVTVALDDTVRVRLTLEPVGLELGEVTVSAGRGPNERPVSLGKVAIAPMDLPQAVASLDQATLEQRQVLRLGDALAQINGVYVMGTTGGTQEELAGRGFPLTNSTFKDGVRFNNALMPEMSGVERLEVMKGSSAILFGLVSAGGVVNLVTRKPRFERGAEASIRVGSYGLVKPSLDLTGPVPGLAGVAYRVNGTYERADSFRDQVHSERYYVNPSLVAQLGSRTQVLIEADRLKDERTLDYGTGAVAYTVADVPRTRFLGAPWSRVEADQSSATATLTHRLDDRWELRAVAGGQRYDSDLFGTTRPNAGGSFVAADGRWVRGAQRSQLAERYGLGELDLTGRLTTGPLEHRLLIGTDGDRTRTEATAFQTLARYDTVNIFRPDLGSPRTDQPELTPRTRTTTPSRRVGVYVQDLVGLTERIKLLAGLRWSRLMSTSDVTTLATGAVQTSSQRDEAYSPRVGLVVQPRRSLSLFGSFANAFSPNTGTDISGNPLPPSMLDQIELGAKTEWWGDRLTVNLTGYRIVNRNLAQMSLEGGNTNSSIKELAGAVLARGVELDVTGRHEAGLTLTAGYAYNRTTYQKSNIYEVGSLLRYNPAQTAHASVFYTPRRPGLWHGTTVGATVAYVGERQAGRSTRRTVPNDTYRLIPLAAFTQLDLSLGYDLGPLSTQLKLSNTLDALAYHAHDDNSLNPIAPRQLSLTTRFRF